VSAVVYVTHDITLLGAVYTCIILHDRCWFDCPVAAAATCGLH
jgi:hypothetical protein